MLPEWMRETDHYDVPPKDGGTFVIKTIQTIGKIMSRLKIQAGHEKKRHFPAMVKLFAMVLLIIVTSVCQDRVVLLAIAAVLLGYLCTWPAKGLWGVLKPPVAAAALTFVLLIPAMLMNPAGISNNLVVVGKVFLCVTMVTIFNHTTQWNHVTLALRKLHVPGVFVFTLDITLKYIVLLGNLMQDLLTSMQLRAIGKHDKKYSSIGGVMGVTFIRGTEMNEQMYEAMRCRGFTDDYRGL